MKANREKFKHFVTEQLKDYDEWREASPDGYADIITDEAVKLFCQPAVMRSFSLEEMKQAFKAGKEWIWEDLEQTTMCSKYESFEEWFENYA